MYAEAGPSTHSSRTTSASRDCSSHSTGRQSRRPLQQSQNRSSPEFQPASTSGSPVDFASEETLSHASIAADDVACSSLSNTVSRRRSNGSNRWSFVSLVTVMVFTLLAASGLVDAQSGEPNNITTLAGTWSSGSGAVVTGLEFFNPGTGVFTYPKAAGQSYSFTDDGHWEQALYIYETNPAKPSCVSAQLIWQHGTYQLHSNNNSLTLTPFKGDGRQQISDRCASESNRISAYNQVETMLGFEIHLDTHYTRAAYSLQLYEFDGNPKPLMWQVYNPPQMLPTEQLHVEIIGSVAD